VQKLNLVNKLVDTMSKTQGAFRHYAAHVVELNYDLLPNILDGVDEGQYKRNMVTALLAGLTGFMFLHRQEQVSLVHVFPISSNVVTLMYSSTPRTRLPHISLNGS
jgi:hypothetical protein